MKIISIILFTILSFSLSGQSTNDTTGMVLFNRGMEHYKNKNLDSTLILWTQIVENKIGKNYDTYGNAFFNIPTLYWQMENYEKAKEWYKKILSSDLRDDDETGSLMEPHTNYKYKSAMSLTELYYADSNYEEALNWLYQADTLYRYWGFEGSATNVCKRQANLLKWKIELLQKLNKKNQVIKAIVTELICSDRYDSFFKSSEDTLLNIIDKKAFKKDFDKALNQLEISKIDKSNWIAAFSLNEVSYKIPISNTLPDRNLPHYWTIYFIDNDAIPNKESIIEYVKNRSFYTRLKNR